MKYDITMERAVRQRVTVQVEADSPQEAIEKVDVDCDNDPPDHLWIDLSVFNREVTSVEKTN